MKLYNPTDSQISVRIFGVDYTVDPKSETVELDPDTALYWKGLHSFLQEKEAKVEVATEPKEVKETKVTKKK